MHPRDPKFIEKARVILDLYAGFWRGKRLGPDDQIISADEKTSIQARRHQRGDRRKLSTAGRSQGRCRRRRSSGSAGLRGTARRSAHTRTR